MGPVGIVGNFNLDIVIGSVKELPKWNAEIMANNYEKRLAGTAGYMGMALNALGLSPIILSSVGDDQDGEYLLGQLNLLGCETDGIIPLKKYKTPTGFVIFNEDGSRAIVSVSGAHDEFDVKMYHSKKYLLSSCSEVVICGNYLLPKFTVLDAIEVAVEQRSLGKKIYFDPSWDPNGWKKETRDNTFELLKHIDVCLLNETEICHLANETEWEKALNVIGEYCKEVVVKLGENGSATFVNGKIFKAGGYHVPVVFDTTGAGDVFDMGYLFAGRKEWPINKRLDFANKVASLVISQETRENYPDLKKVESTFLSNKF